MGEAELVRKDHQGPGQGLASLSFRAHIGGPPFYLNDITLDSQSPRTGESKVKLYPLLNERVERDGCRWK